MKRKLVVAAISTFCLTVTLFLAIPESYIGDYDPWLDINDDGKIDIKDLAAVARAYGALGTPINKTDLLLGLEDRVNSIEERLGYVKTIRFLNPNETINDLGIPYKDGAVFTWVPQNSIVNAILSIHCYFQYRTKSVGGLEFRLNVNGETHEAVELPHRVTYTQSPVFTFINNAGCNAYSLSLSPNKDNYTLTFQFASLEPAFAAYVRDVNIIVETIDGLPES